MGTEQVALALDQGGGQPVAAGTVEGGERGGEARRRHPGQRRGGDDLAPGGVRALERDLAETMTALDGSTQVRDGNFRTLPYVGVGSAGIALVLNEFRQQLRTELRTQAQRGRLTEGTVVLLKTRLADVRAELLREFADS